MFRAENFRLIIRRDIWIFHSKVFSSDNIIYEYSIKKSSDLQNSLIQLFCLMVSQAVSNMMEEFDWHRLVLLYRFTIYYFIITLHNIFFFIDKDIISHGIYFLSFKTKYFFLPNLIY